MPALHNLPSSIDHQSINNTLPVYGGLYAKAALIFILCHIHLQHASNLEVLLTFALKPCTANAYIQMVRSVTTNRSSALQHNLFPDGEHLLDTHMYVV